MVITMNKGERFVLIYLLIIYLLVVSYIRDSKDARLK